MGKKPGENELSGKNKKACEKDRGILSSSDRQAKHSSKALIRPAAGQPFLIYSWKKFSGHKNSGK